MTEKQISTEAAITAVMDDDGYGDCVDDATFLAIMSALPTGVTIVTTIGRDGTPRGLTCSAVCSLSKEPPLLLVCIHRHSSALQEIKHTGRFTVNFLRESREAISALFATPVDSRFESIEWARTDRFGLPWFPRDTTAHAECDLVQAIDAGDHTIVIGAIVSGKARDDSYPPLMYWRRRYSPWPADREEMNVAMASATEG
jgi:flavin reductase (NADH)